MAGTNGNARGKKRKPPTPLAPLEVAPVVDEREALDGRSLSLDDTAVFEPPAPHPAEHGVIPDADAPPLRPDGARAPAPVPPEEPAPVRRGLAGVVHSFWSTLNIRGIKGGYGGFPLVMLTLITLLEYFELTAYAQVLPEIQRDFEVNAQSLGVVLTFVPVVTILLSGPIGFIGDRKRRTTMSAIGGLVNAISPLGTALAPNIAILGGMRAVGAQGREAVQAVRFGLIADYYPLDERTRAFSFRQIGAHFGELIAPLFVGVLGVAFGWRMPFLVVGVGYIIVSLVFFKLKEPIRGYQERLAFGADEEVARREQEAPSWGEAWRAAWGIRTLRRIGYSLPFFTLFSQGAVFVLPFVMARVFGLDLLERGYIGAAQSAVGIIGIAVGAPLVGRFLGRNPGRVIILIGLVGIFQAFTYAGLAFTRSLPIALTFLFAGTFTGYILLPAQTAVYSSVIPPRLRNLGLATLQYWQLIGLIAGLPIVFVVANDFGFRAALLSTVPILILAQIIFMTAGPFVEFDIRSANAASMASEAWRRAKEAGRAKMLVVRDLDVHYGTVQVLFGIDLDVDEGEIMALLGTNGAGKSTLLKAISGVQVATGGAVVFDGRDVTRVPPNEIVRYGIVHMPGGRGVFPGLTVRENLTLAGWLYGEDPKHDEEVEKVFEYFPVLRTRLEQKAGTLSGGEQQMLALSQAFLSRPKLLCIDELSLGLAPAVVEQLLEIIRAIHANGTTVILVEQSVNVALTVAERAIFMEKGQIRFDGPTAELLERPDILRAVFLKGASASIGEAIREISDGGRGAPTTIGGAPVQPDLSEAAPVLVATELGKSYGGVIAVDDVSLTLREGEILGFIGPNGAGKTTVLEMLSGFVIPDRGQIVYEGRDITQLPPEDRAQQRLIRRFQDANLFPSLTVFETLAIAFERAYDVRSVFLEGLGAPQARVSEQRVRKRVDRLIEILELEAYADKFINELSTGTRRVVDIACVLAAEPKVLLLDEPSSGMAQREAENLVPLLRRVRQETGCSMIVVEHDIPLISALSDEIVAFELGRVLMRGTPDVVLEDERVVRSYLGTTEEIINRSSSV